VTDSPLRIGQERGGRLLRLTLDRPKANLVDNEMVAALDVALSEGEGDRDLLCVLIDHSGPAFSYGASVQEHRPETCADMLQRFHALIVRMIAFPLPILVAAKGHCLGGGLELALAGRLVFATRDADIGQPEIKLGVFAPAASCLLADWIGQSAAFDLLTSGRRLTGEEAQAIGLVHATAEDPAAAALRYFDDHYAAHSASSLRFAVEAARGDRAERVSARLVALERLYLDGLMRTTDPVEGLAAFLDKRPPRWRNG
jgi:cyclohexa-1,5-dienecarbonyl-CoA hydratase